MEHVRIEDLKPGSAKDLEVDGVFVAIGYRPNNDMAVKLGLELDPEGYIKVDRSQRTTMPFVYAACDIAGEVKQIAVAVGQGSIAAISAFEDLSNPYWQKGSQTPSK